MQHVLHLYVLSDSRAAASATVLGQQPTPKYLSDRLKSWKQRARLLKTEAHALYLAYRDPRIPWYARVYAAFVVGYIFSPIDPIPDFIPLIGYLDELLLVPVFVFLARKLIPALILAEHRATARAATGFGTRKHWLAAAVIITVWLVIAIAAGILTVRLMR